VAALLLFSSAFSDGGPIPALHTCDGADISPPLSWQAQDSSIVSYALVCEDPDAPLTTWTHWVIFNIPATTDSLPQGLSTESRLPDGSCQGLNSWGRTGYGGPCPPSGTHRYFFRLYALDAMLDLPSRSRPAEVARAMDGHVICSASLMGTYSRHR
jgi:Raf kinase inhibitor-like YbhB/YbcL family protein